MPTLAGQGGGIALRVDRLLLFADGGRWLERHTDHDRFTIADSPLNSAGVVGACAEASRFCGDERIVVFTAFEQGSVEA